MLEFINVIIIIFTHGIAYYSVHSCSPYGKIKFHNPAHRHIILLCFTCLVCVCLNRWTHSRAPAFINYFTHTHTRARIHSFSLTLTGGKTTFSHDQILINPKSNGLVHDVCIKKICVCCTVFAEALI